MASPALKTHSQPCTNNTLTTLLEHSQAPSQDIQPLTPLSNVKRSLTHINLPSILEPVGLTLKGDRKRSNRLTLGSWYRGPSLVVREAKVVDTFAWGHYKDSARQASKDQHQQRRDVPPV